MTVNIRGKEYVTVAERLQEIHKDLKMFDITTEVLLHAPVVVKATVKTNKGTFTGVSAANPTKSIEKQSPYEVAETSAVGRALIFAGYSGGLAESIASAEEMEKAGVAAEPVDLPITEEQIACLKEYMIHYKVEEPKFLKYLKVDSLVKIMQSQYPKAISALKTKEKKKEAAQ